LIPNGSRGAYREPIVVVLILTFQLKQKSPKQITQMQIPGLFFCLFAIAEKEGKIMTEEEEEKMRKN